MDPTQQKGHMINQDRQVNISYLYANIYQEQTESVV